MNNKINVIAIDDEPLALLQLQQMIERTPFFQLIAACPSVFDAMKAMEEQPCDALFADINMPDLSGLDFVRSLQNPPIIVFTTAYTEYAIDAYKVNAIDYLLKPFGMADFQRAANKVKQQYELLKAAAASPKSNSETPEHLSDNGRIEGNILFAKDGYHIVRITLDNILYIEAQSEYLKIFLTDKTSHMILMPIKNIADILPTDRFVRIHRSYIVNMSHIIDITRLRIRIDKDTTLSIGDSYKEKALKFINDRLIGK